MPSNILVDGLGLTYKGSAGISTATLPDVCKTPSPGGPVPLPYPNVAKQSSLQNGTTTVKAHGQMIAVKGSQYGSSNGDEAGTAGGVKSSVNMKATDWITYSFDVKIDGQNACRHTDKKFHNNQNTVDLAGNFDPNNPPAGLTDYQNGIWKGCVEQHNKYDAIKDENKKHSDDYKEANGETFQATKNKVFNNRASDDEKMKFLNFLNERIEIFERLNVERQTYVNMDCDEIPWKGGKPTKDARKNAHLAEIASNDRNITNHQNGIAKITSSL